MFRKFLLATATLSGLDASKAPNVVVSVNLDISTNSTESNSMTDDHTTGALTFPLNSGFNMKPKLNGEELKQWMKSLEDETDNEVDVRDENSNLRGNRRRLMKWRKRRSEMKKQAEKNAEHLVNKIDSGEYSAWMFGCKDDWTDLNMENDYFNACEWNVMIQIQKSLDTYVRTCKEKGWEPPTKWNESRRKRKMLYTYSRAFKGEIYDTDGEGKINNLDTKNDFEEAMHQALSMYNTYSYEQFGYGFLNWKRYG